MRAPGTCFGEAERGWEQTCTVTPHTRMPAARTTGSSAPGERACYTGAAWLRRVGGLWPSVPGRLAPGPAVPGVLSTRTEVTVMRMPLSELPEAFPAASPARGSPRTRGSFASGALGREAGGQRRETGLPTRRYADQPRARVPAPSPNGLTSWTTGAHSRHTHRPPGACMRAGPPWLTHAAAPHHGPGVALSPSPPLCRACSEWGSRLGSGVSPGGTHIRCSHSPGPPGWFSEDPGAGGPSLEPYDPLEFSA